MPVEQEDPADATGDHRIDEVMDDPIVRFGRERQGAAKRQVMMGGAKGQRRGEHDRGFRNRFAGLVRA